MLDACLLCSCRALRPILYLLLVGLTFRELFDRALNRNVDLSHLIRLSYNPFSRIHDVYLKKFNI